MNSPERQSFDIGVCMPEHVYNVTPCCFVCICGQRGETLCRSILC